MWEYHVEHIWTQELGPTELKDKLNSFGKFGWNLVAIDGSKYIFKRLKQDAGRA